MRAKNLVLYFAFVFSWTMYPWTIEAASSSLVGRWEVTALYAGAPVESRLIIDLEDGRYVTTLDRLRLTGTAAGKSVRFACHRKDRSCGEVTLTAKGDTLEGRGALDDVTVTLTGRR